MVIESDELLTESTIRFVVNCFETLVSLRWKCVFGDWIFRQNCTIIISLVIRL